MATKNFKGFQLVALATFNGSDFTKDERDMIWQRLKIVTLLKKKIPQYEIAKILNASLCSITRGAKELKKPNSALSTIVDKYLINNEEFQESLNKSLQKQ